MRQLPDARGDRSSPVRPTFRSEAPHPRACRRNAGACGGSTDRRKVQAKLARRASLPADRGHATRAIPSRSSPTPRSIPRSPARRESIARVADEAPSRSLRFERIRAHSDLPRRAPSEASETAADDHKSHSPSQAMEACGANAARCAVILSSGIAHAEQQVSRPKNRDR